MGVRSQILLDILYKTAVALSNNFEFIKKLLKI